MSGAALITTHLNAPYGPVVRESDVIDSIRGGRLTAHSESALAIVAGLFFECRPQLILRCAQEIGATDAQANQLYLDTISARVGMSRCPPWESAVELLL